jgi:predicted cation transporter
MTLALVLAQLETLSGKAGGLIAQALALLLGLAAGWISLVVIWNLLASMLKNPNFDKLLGIVAVGLFAMFLVGAAPALLAAAYALGQDIAGGGG